MSETPSPIPELFADYGLRCTRQRLALYAALENSDIHPTADELFRLVSDHDPNISLATVYNTLETFCEKGLAQRLPGAASGGGPARYDAGRDPHLHIRCRDTGRLADVPDNLGRKILNHIPEATLKQLEKELGFKVERVQIELVGEFAKGPCKNRLDDL